MLRITVLEFLTLDKRKVMGMALGMRVTMTRIMMVLMTLRTTVPPFLTQIRLTQMEIH